MATFTVNGQTVTSSKNQKLLRFLRDELHLISVKDGCSEGACGACTVLINGKTCKACVPDTDQLEGKDIITVEGLSEWENRYIPMHMEKPVQYSADSVFRGWSCVPRHFWIKIWSLLMMKSGMHFEIITAGVPDT